MNKEDIIRMAREAGFVWLGEYHSNLEDFAALVASAERERIKQANAPEIERINAHIKEALAQTDNTSKLYEELRVLIDGGSESFTHKDAVQYLKDNLAPLKWTPEDTAHRSGGLPMAQPEQHQDWCASLTQMLMSMPPKPAPCNCKAQPEQEPVAYLCENAVGHKYFRWKKSSSTYKPIALYATPPQRTWVGLTEEELYEIYDESDDGSSPCGVCGACSKCKIEVAIARAIEAKLKEKNHG
jgi:hypothetical protein